MTKHKVNTIADFQGSDIIDVRDIIARVEELREIIADYENPEGDLELHDSHIEEKEELEKLESLLSDLCGYGGDEQWEGNWYPVTLINENYFEQAMDSDVKDFGYIPKDLPSFLTITVDYDALKQDYSEVEFMGYTYYYR